jgi:histidinol dehydrogenase
LAQAEHDSYAKAYLFTDSSDLLNKVKSSLPKSAGNSIKLIKTSMSNAIDEINAIAPEHLEITVKNPDAVIKKIKNAGAIFAGSYTPTAVGDYWAGPSHVLPTGGSAKFSSGLSVLTFLKRTSYINYSKDKIKKDAKFISSLAEAEGLVNHSSSVLARR